MKNPFSEKNIEKLKLDFNPGTFRISQKHLKSINLPKSQNLNKSNSEDSISNLLNLENLKVPTRSIITPRYDSRNKFSINEKSPLTVQNTKDLKIHKKFKTKEAPSIELSSKQFLSEISELKQLIRAKDHEIEVLRQINNQIIKSQEAKNNILKDFTEQIVEFKKKIFSLEKELEKKEFKLKSYKSKLELGKHKGNEELKDQKESNKKDLKTKFEINSKKDEKNNNKLGRRSSKFDFIRNFSNDEDLLTKSNKSNYHDTALITLKQNCGKLITMDKPSLRALDYDSVNKHNTMNFYSNLTGYFSSSNHENLSLNMMLFGPKSILKFDNTTFNKLTNSERMMSVSQALLNFKEFKTIVHSKDDSTLDELYLSLKSIINDYKSIITILSKVNLLLHNQHIFCERVLIEDIFEKICEIICQIINCDRCTLYIVDHSRKELWSKKAKLLDTIIRLPFGTGIAGYVAVNKTPIILEDVYFDPRFNKDFDLQTGYRTKSVICMPVIDEKTNVVIGVLQALNKKSKPDIFDKNDITITEIICKMICNQLRQSMEYSDFTNYDYKLKKLLATIHTFYLEENIQRLIHSSYEILKTIFTTEKIQIVYLSDQTETYTKYYVEKHELIELKNGLVTYVKETKQLRFSHSTKSDNYHNLLIDIDTTLPLITYPIIDHKNKDVVLAVIQIEYLRREVKFGEVNEKEIDSLDFDILGLLSANLAGALSHLRFKSLKTNNMMERI